MRGFQQENGQSDIIETETRLTILKQTFSGFIRSVTRNNTLIHDGELDQAGKT